MAPCPCCGAVLTADQIKALWGAYTRSKRGPVDPEKAKARAEKAAAARWAKKDTSRARRGGKA